MIKAAVAITVAVVVRPSLWLTALRQWWRTTPRDWWRHRPFLPVPSRDYLRFRLVTQYGSTNAHIEPADVVNYLMWCKQQDHAE